MPKSITRSNQEYAKEYNEIKSRIHPPSPIPRASFTFARALQEKDEKQMNFCFVFFFAIFVYFTVFSHKIGSWLIFLGRCPKQRTPPTYPYGLELPN